MNRADPRSLVPFARAAYEAGKSRSEVLTAIYGVDLPREADLIYRDFYQGKKPLRVLWKAHPWELMIPLADGGPTFMLGGMEQQDDVRTFLQAPHLLLVASLRYPRVPNGFSLIAYDLNEIAAGRTTVVAMDPALDKVPESGAVFTKIGDSLLEVLSGVVRSYLERWTRDTREDAEESQAATLELAGVQALQDELR